MAVDNVASNSFTGLKVEWMKEGGNPFILVKDDIAEWRSFSMPCINVQVPRCINSSGDGCIGFAHVNQIVISQ